MNLRAVLPLVLACTGFAWAQEDKAPLSVEQLRARLAALETEYAADAERAEGAEAKARQELDAMRTRRRELAEQVVTSKLEGHRLREERRRLEAELTREGDLAEALRQEVGVVIGAVAALAEQLGFALDGVPAAGEGAAQLSKSLGQLETGAPSARAAAAARILAVVDDAHADACSVTLKEATVRTASGELEAVELLAVGHVAFAYRTLQEGRIGIALGSPADASGYRWSEEIPSDDAAGLAAAMDAVKRGARDVAIPLDVTGRLRTDSVVEGWDLRRLFLSGGPLMWPLGAAALVALLLIVERAVFLLRQGGRGEALLERVLAACREGRFEAAYENCTKERGMVARALAACLRRREGGQAAMEDSIQEQLLHDLPRLQRALGGIATLGAVAPLLGLLGTVTGIIQTFGVIKVYGNANPGLMAGGISEALVTTATGLVIAIPILLAHSILSGRADHLVSAAEKSAATLLNALAEER